MSTKKIHLNIKSSIFHSRKLELAQYLPTYTDTNKQIILMQEVFWARKWNWTLPCSYVDEVEEHHKVHIFQIFKQQQNENHLEWLPGLEPAVVLGIIQNSLSDLLELQQESVFCKGYYASRQSKGKSHPHVHVHTQTFTPTHMIS